MKVLGVDPGSFVTGYGVIESQKTGVKLLEAGIIKPKHRDLLPHRLEKVYVHLGEVMETYKPDVVILEKLYTHAQYLTTSSVLGHVRGVICLLCAQKNILLAENSVKRIRKAVTGNGSATKEQTQAMVAHILHVRKDDLTPDASDALALALGYLSIGP